MFLNKNKLAFTLAEVLVTLGIIGVIVAFFIPLFINSMPSQEEKMHKKMSYLVEQIAFQMYDNEAFYPRTSDVAKQGFLNTDEVTIDGQKYGGNTDDDRKSKFCKLFARQFNMANNKAVSCPSTIFGTEPSFRSADGVDWWIPKTTFWETTNGQVKGFVRIKIDVNGNDKGDNCTEGSSGCYTPDVFYYYIKSNGSVTLSNPTAIENRTYEINREITTKDAAGNPESTAGGVLEIAPINDDGTFGTFLSDASKFTNLTANKNYMLRAKPNPGYITNWASRETSNATEKRYGYKKVRTTKVKTNVQLEFRKIKTYCIKAKVSCPSTNIDNCIATKQYKYNCKYVFKGAGNGDYERVSENLGNYNYVGPFEGDYKYECSSSADLTKGTGDDAGYVTACNLESGDYQLYVVPKSGMKILPYNNDNAYLQTVRLGTSDLSDFEVEIGY